MFKNPNIINTYNKYKDRGIMFMSASSPKDSEAILDAEIYEMLVSYFYIQKRLRKYSEEVIPRIKEHDGLFMTDSGGFSFINSLAESDDLYTEEYWMPYLEEYVQWLHDFKEHIFVAANLDLDIYVGRDIVDKWNDKYFKPLEKWMNVVYVAHKDTSGYYADKNGLRRVRQYAKEHEYIGINQSMKNVSSQVFETARINKNLVHGFAWTSIPMLKSQPLFSVDSSVAYDSFVLVKKGGSVENVEIGKLFHRHIFESLKTTPTEDYAEIPYYETLTLDENNKIVWKPVKAIVRHVVTKKRVKIYLEGGRDIVCTCDHSLISRGSMGETFEVKADSLTKGSYVLGRKDFPKQIGREFFTVTIKTKGKKSFEDVTVEMDEAFLTFLGLWLGDGSTIEDSVQVSCYQDEECKNIIDKIALRFGSGCVTVKDGGVTGSISSVKLVRIMESLQCVGKADTKRVSPFIMSLSKQQVSYFIRGYYSADGCGFDGAFSTVSKYIKEDMLELLTIFHIYPSTTTTGKKEYIIRGKKGVAKVNYRCTIRDYHSRVNFYEQIGFLQEYKNKSMKDGIDRDVHKLQRGSEKMGIPKELSLTGRIAYPSSKQKSYYPYIEKAKGGRVRRELNREHFSSKVLDAEVMFLRVNRIEELPLEEIDVYDLDVPGTQKFIANGVVVHNTTWLGGTKFGVTYHYDGKNFVALDRKYKYVRKFDKLFCKQQGISYDDLMKDKADAVNRYNLIAWKGARQEYIRAANVKLWNKPIYHYERLCGRKK